VTASGPPCSVSSFRLRARLGFSIPSTPPGPRGITPAFGYGAPHSSARGTSTLLNNALLSAHYRPSRFPLAVHRLPGVTGYTASLLRRFLDGTRRVSPVAQHDLVTVLSLPTPPKCFAASVFCDAPCCLRPKSEGSAFGVQYSRGHTGSLALRPGDSLTIHKMALSIGFRIFSCWDRDQARQL
jgi:hypothetical protein